MDGNAWPEIRIGDLGDVFTGRTPPTVRPAYFGNEFPFITPGDMRQGKYARATERGISHEGADLLKRIKLPANTVCVSCIGWQMGEVIMTSKPSFTNQQINSIVPNGKVDASFLYYSLRPRKQELLSLGSATGVRTPILNKSAFCDLRVKLPSLPVQRRITSILSAYDDLIENNLRRIRILEEMARSLYREWFVHFRFHGNETTTGAATSTGSKVMDTQLGDLGDLCGLTKEPFDETSQSELPLLDLAHIPSRSLATNDTGKSSELTTSRILFQPGDTLFGAIRSYLHKVVLAPYAGVTNVSVLVLRPKQPEFRSLLAIVASSTDTIRWADQHSTGTKMPVINWNVLKMMPVAVPNPTLAARFEKIAGPMLDDICLLSIKNQVLHRTRDLLLPQLLSTQ